MRTEEKTAALSSKLLRIDDPSILKILDRDNQELMVSLLDIPRLVLPSKIKPQIPNITDSMTPFARKTIKDKLLTAVQLLPEQYSLVLIEAQRTVGFQKEVFQQVAAELKEQHPSMPENELIDLTRTMVSDPDIFSPHVTGGALDVAVADQKTLRYLDMGNLFQHDETAATHFQGLNEQQAHNRKILIDTMTQSGFVNYPREWWHWSYGDKLWAHLKQQPKAIYGPVK